MKWIKLMTDIYDNKKIKYLRKLPGGNDVALIWTMMLTVAGKCNAGGAIYLTEDIPYTASMLANELDFPEETMRFALETFVHLNMIVLNGDYIVICGWNDCQSASSSSASQRAEHIREQNRERKRRQREKERAAVALPAKIEDVEEIADKTEAQENAAEVIEYEPCTGHAVTKMSRSSHENVTALYIKNKKESYKIYSAADAARQVSTTAEPSKEVIEIIDHLNSRAGTHYQYTTKETISLIDARLLEGYTIDDFKCIIDKKCADWLNDSKMSRYLRPKTLFAASNFESYLNQLEKRHGNTSLKNSFHNFKQRQYDFSALESALLARDF